MRLRITRRSISIFVSPGPREPMPASPAARPPACRDSDPPQPRSRGSMYWSCASSTWALPSREVACWAKMSRITAVRSTTFTLVASSKRGVGLAAGRRPQRWCRLPLAPRFRRVRGLYRSNVCSCVRLDTMLQQAVAYHCAGGFGKRGKFSQ